MLNRDNINSKHASIDQILEKGKFIKVDKSNFDAEVTGGKSVLFFYDVSGKSLPSLNFYLAEIFAEFSRKFPQIKFLAYKAFVDRLNEDDYVRNFGFIGVPSYAYYKDGFILLGYFGGPSSDREYHSFRSHIERELRYLAISSTIIYGGRIIHLN